MLDERNLSPVAGGEGISPTPPPPADTEHLQPTESSPGRLPRQLIFGIGVVVSAAGNFGFHAIAARQLAPQRYSELAALLALAVALAVPISAMQTALSASVARTLARGEGVDLRQLARRVWVGAGAALIVVAGLSPLIGGQLRIDSHTAIALVGAWLACTALELVTEGALLGAGRANTVGVCLAVGGLTRVGAGLVLIHDGGLVGAMSATVVAEALVALLFALSVQRANLQGAGETATPAAVRFGDAALTLGSQLAHWSFAGCAVVLGRRYLPGDEVGNFAAAATLAGAGVFLPQAVALTSFPGFASLPRPGKALASALAVAGGLGLGMIVGVVLFHQLAIDVLFGASYQPSRNLMVVLTTGSALLGCLGVLSHFLVARRHHGALIPWAWLTLAVLTVSNGPAEPMTIAWRLAACLAGAVAVASLLAAREAGRAHHANAQQTSTATAGPVAGLLSRPATRELSVVLPSYNTGAQLRPAVENVIVTLAAAGIDAEVIVVIDGSTDGSDGTLVGLEDRITVVHQPRNGGKGEALRSGFNRSGGSVVGFIDSDGDIDASVLLALHERLRQPGCWAAVASKWHPEAEVRSGPVRKVLSGGFRLISTALFRLSVVDTQCGCKLFRREYLEATLRSSRQRGFALDLELLALGARNGFGTVAEVPVQLARIGTHTITAKAVVRTFGDTLEVWRSVRRTPRVSLALPGDLLSPVEPTSAVPVEVPTPPTNDRWKSNRPPLAGPSAVPVVSPQLPSPTPARELVKEV